MVDVSGETEPLCFRVAQVVFLFHREERDPLPLTELACLVQSR